MLLKKLGCYRELSYGEEHDPSIKDFIHSKIDNKKELCEYLRKGQIIAACGGVVKDVICPEKGIIGSPDDMTDGTWIWSADLAYYVEEYDLMLDSAFVSHAKKNGWDIPENIVIDPDNIEVI